MKKLTLPIIILALVGLVGCNQNTRNQNNNQQTTSNQQQESQSPDTTTTQTASTGQSYDPCELLTASDVEAEFSGKTATNSQHDKEANVVGQKICFYDLDPDEMIFAQLAITNGPDIKAAGQTAKSLYDGVKDFAEEVNPVQGLGTEAYYGGSGLTPGAGLHVYVAEKDVFFDVTVGLGFGNDDDNAHLEIEKSLAEKVINKL